MSRSSRGIGRLALAAGVLAVAWGAAGAAAQLPETPGAASVLAPEDIPPPEAAPEPLRLARSFRGVAGRVDVTAPAGLRSALPSRVSLVRKGGNGERETLAAAATDGERRFLLAAPESLPTEEAGALYLEATTGTGTLRAPYVGTVSHVSAATDAAWRLMESRFPSLAPGQAGLLIDLARSAGRRIDPSLAGVDASLEIERRLQHALLGLEVYFSSAAVSPALQALRDYVDLLQLLRRDLRVFCAGTGFTKPEAEALLDDMETRVDDLQRIQSILDQEETAAALHMTLRKLDSDLELLLFLLMVHDLGNDNLAAEVSRLDAERQARDLCAYLDDQAGLQLAWVPELATHFEVQAGNQVPVPDDVPTSQDDMNEAQTQPSSDASVEFVFLHPAKMERERLEKHADRVCAWQELSKWKCAVLELQGKQFTCNRPNDDCCVGCTCFEPRCGFPVGCETCLDPMPGTYVCYTRTELDTGAHFTVPLSQGLVGLLVRIADPRQLIDEQGRLVAVLELLYDGVPIASTRPRGGSGPRWVGPPFDSPWVYQMFTDANFDLALESLRHLYADPVVDKVEFLVGKPSQAEAGEHHSLHLESRGDLFNGALVVWRVSLHDGMFAITGVRNPTTPSCAPLGPPANQVFQPHYFGSMGVDLKQLASNGYPGTLREHVLRAVLTLPGGQTVIAEEVLAAPVGALNCAPCAGAGPSGLHQVNPPRDEIRRCETVLGDDIEFHAFTQIERIGNRVINDYNGFMNDLLVKKVEDSIFKRLDLPSWAHVFEREKGSVQTFGSWTRLNSFTEWTLNGLSRTMKLDWGAPRKFSIDVFKKEIIARLTAGELPTDSFSMTIPGWIQDASQLQFWYDMIDHCHELLCPEASREIRQLRDQMKALADGTLGVYQAYHGFHGWAGNLFEYGNFLSSWVPVDIAAGRAQRLGDILTGTKLAILLSEPFVALTSDVQIALLLKQAENVIKRPGAFRGPGGSCP